MHRYSFTKSRQKQLLFGKNRNEYSNTIVPQLTFTCSIETLERGVKYVQISHFKALPS